MVTFTRPVVLAGIEPAPLASVVEPKGKRGQTNFQDLVFVSALAVPTLRIAFTERFRRLGLIMAVH